MTNCNFNILSSTEQFNNYNVSTKPKQIGKKTKKGNKRI